MFELFGTRSTVLAAESKERCRIDARSGASARDFSDEQCRCCGKRWAQQAATCTRMLTPYLGGVAFVAL
jgi:hypothetical protein